MNTAQKRIASTAIVALIVAFLFTPKSMVIVTMVGTTAVAGFMIVLASGPEPMKLSEAQKQEFETARETEREARHVASRVPGYIHRGPRF